MTPTVRHEHVVVDGMDIHYAAAGDGPPIVFLHGLGASCITWQDNIGPLSERFSVYALDIPGHGDSVKLGVSYNTEAGVSLTLGFLDAIGAQVRGTGRELDGGPHRFYSRRWNTRSGYRNWRSSTRPDSGGRLPATCG